jgi:hypothetical protein
MIELEYQMTYAETIDRPLGPTTGSPPGERLCWQVSSATLRGPRIDATLTMPGSDWMRLGSDWTRRQDLRAQFVTDDGQLILFRYDLALIRSSDRFLSAIASGEATEFEDQHMRIAPQLEVANGPYAWPARACSSDAADSPGPKPSPMSSTASYDNTPHENRTGCVRTHLGQRLVRSSRYEALPPHTQRHTPTKPPCAPHRSRRLDA